MNEVGGLEADAHSLVKGCRHMRLPREGRRMVGPHRFRDPRDDGDALQNRQGWERGVVEILFYCHGLDDVAPIPLAQQIPSCWKEL